jgi:hypothetical protein
MIFYFVIIYLFIIVPGDQEGLFKLAVQLRKFFNSVPFITLQVDMFCWFI